MRLEFDKTYVIDVRFRLSQRRGIATSRSKDEEDDDDDEQLHPFHLLHPSTFDQSTVRRLAVLFRSAGDSEGGWSQQRRKHSQSVAERDSAASDREVLVCRCRVAGTEAMEGRHGFGSIALRYDGRTTNRMLMR